MGTDKKGINTVFSVLGSVAAIGLMTTGIVWWSYYDPAPIGSVESQETQSGSSDSQAPSGRNSAPEKQHSESSTAKPEKKTGLDTPTDTSGTTPDETANKSSASRVYIIQPGDTLSGISASVGVSVDRLAQANSIANVNLIYTGSSLVIPAS